MTISENELAARLRTLLRGELHVGRLRGGDRLPSIRELARQHGVDHRMVANVCRRLAGEGLVEVRERAGVFVGRAAQAPPLSGAEGWIGTMLCEARARHISLPDLAAFMTRLCEGRIRCAVLDETDDHLVAFEEELRAFGLTVVPCKVRQRGTAGRLAERERLTRLLERVDLAVTTSFHAADLKDLTDGAGIPLVEVSVADRFGEELRKRLSRGKLTVVVADERYRARAEAYFAAPMGAGRLRVLLAHETAAAGLRPASDVLFTRAARLRLGLPGPHLLDEAEPYFAPATVAALVGAMIQVAGSGDRPPRIETGAPAAGDTTGENAARPQKSLGAAD
ncbi:hypothetical protein BH23GEM9_BH23GEM9_03580 [soil metagenome]